jgi:acyl-CoA thioesterase-2
VTESTAEEQTPLQQARLAALDGLLRALELEPLGDDRYRAAGEPRRFDRTFGGQLVAQALAAAGATAPGKRPSSLHAYFAAAGAPSDPVELDVHRVRNGRSMATRQVSLGQDGRTLLTMIASFVGDRSGRELIAPLPAAPAPTDVPTLQDWVPHAPEALGAHSTTWVDRPPPIEIRIAEPPVFLGGVPSTAPRSHWIRLARPVGDDPLLQVALLAYASDFLLLDMAFRSHPVPFSSGRLSGASLDHSVWFHGPVRFDRWHRYTQETVALAGDRGLVRGSIHDAEGHLVASVAQEVLVRVAPALPD